MNFISLKKLNENINDFSKNEIFVCGWIKNIRSSNKIGFIELNDGSCFKSTQIVFEDNLENFLEISKLNNGSAITVKGNICLTPQAKQSYEIKATDIYIEGHSTPEYPLQNKRHSFEFLRTLAHIRPRTNTFSAVFRVRSVVSFALHKFFNENGFVNVHTPIITGSDCEGAGEMFKVTTLDLNNIPINDEGNIDFNNDFFSKQTNLTVSGQLNGECFALAFSKIYTFGPTFRAENSNTARHSAEFWMIEPEIAFSDLNDDMNLAENMLKYVIGYVLKNCSDELEFFNQFIDNGLLNRLKLIIESDFEHITYTKAIEILEKEKWKFEFPVFWGCDLQTEHERYLTEQIFNKPVFVTDYPKEIKAFYMRLNDDNKTVAAMDLLVPSVGELIGGSQREERHEVLLQRMKECRLSEQDYHWYLDLRKYGTVQHCGFGLGFERLLMYITGMSNIRDVIPFPRTKGNALF